ncbi:hypothetical protein UlMin_019411 [Ulmus minor]
MYGMFRANGGCGYVKKPEFLMKLGPDYKVFDPKTTHLDSLSHPNTSCPMPTQLVKHPIWPS